MYTFKCESTSIFKKEFTLKTIDVNYLRNIKNQKINV